VLLLLLPLWLPFFALGIAILVVVGLVLAPEPPTNDDSAPDLEPDADDDDLPDDYVPPFVPPPREETPVKALPPPRRISVVPAPASVTSATATPTVPDELDLIPVSSWPARFPGG
jgi:hypothetical protein